MNYQKEEIKDEQIWQDVKEQEEAELDMLLIDMFGEGGAEEVKEYYKPRMLK